MPDAIPKYNDDTERRIEFGVTPAAINTLPTSTTGPSQDTSKQLVIYWWEMPLTAGTYTLERLWAKLGGLGTFEISHVSFAVFVSPSSSGNPTNPVEYTRIGSLMLETGSITSTVWRDYTGLDFSFTISENDAANNVRLAICLRKNSTTTGNVHVARMTDLTAGRTWYGRIIGDDVTELPDGSGTFNYVSDTAGPAVGFILRTKNRVISSRSILFTNQGGLTRPFLPRYLDGHPSFLMLRAQTASLTNLFSKWTWKLAGATLADTGVLNRDHTAAPGTLTFGGGSGLGVTLDPNPNAQVGTDTMHLLILYDGAGNADLFYCNATKGQGGQGNLDIAWKSHSVVRTGLRGSTVSAFQGSWLFPEQTSGGGTNWTYQYGDAEGLLIMLGDSQAGASSDRLGGQLPNAFTRKRVTVPAAIGGNMFTATSSGYHTAGYLRYKSTTPGIGDICEMAKFRPILVFAGFGANDASAGVSAALFEQRLAEILSDWRTNNADLLLVGLPPAGVNHPNKTTLDERLMEYNAAVRTSSRLATVTLYDPWALVAANLNTYIETASPHVHYTVVGASAVSAAAAASYEAGLAPGLPVIQSPLFNCSPDLPYEWFFIATDITFLETGVPPLCGVADALIERGVLCVIGSLELAFPNSFSGDGLGLLSGFRFGGYGLFGDGGLASFYPYAVTPFGTGTGSVGLRGVPAPSPPVAATGSHAILGKRARLQGRVDSDGAAPILENPPPRMELENLTEQTVFIIPTTLDERLRGSAYTPPLINLGHRYRYRFLVNNAQGQGTGAWVYFTAVPSDALQPNMLRRRRRR